MSVGRDDPGMHGADWPAMKEKYATFLPDVACRNDLNRLIMWMCSEISVGHHRVGDGNRDSRIALDRVGFRAFRLRENIQRKFLRIKFQRADNR